MSLRKISEMKGHPLPGSCVHPAPSQDTLVPKLSERTCVQSRKRTVILAGWRGVFLAPCSEVYKAGKEQAQGLQYPPQLQSSVHYA